MATVYHGSSMGKLPKFLAAIAAARDGGRTATVYVTDTAEDAARYANAQATRIVDADATAIGPHAAVLAFTLAGEPRWMRRPETHWTLDVCEAVINLSAVEHVEIVAMQDCDYDNCSACRLLRTRERQATVEADWALRRYR